MPGVKISQLPSGGALQPTDQIPIARTGATRHIVASEILDRIDTRTRAVSAAADTKFIPLSAGRFTDYLPLSGGTMTGHINVITTPTSDSHAASKLYVDQKTQIPEVQYTMIYRFIPQSSGTHPTVVTSQPAVLLGYFLQNTATGDVDTTLKIYDKASAPVVASDTPIVTDYQYTAYETSIKTIPGEGYQCTNGIAFALHGNRTLADNSSSPVAADTCLVQIFWKPLSGV
jgi:hypothetical protein